jgi:lysophospholipase L1-like esterase
MTPRLALWRRATVAMGWLLVTLALGCSSPTSPTRPPTTTPPPTPGPTNPPLTLGCPQGPTAASPNGVPVAVTYPSPTPTGGAVGSNGVSLATVSCTPASASLFPVGTTEVRCTATTATESASCTFSVTVTAPVVRLTRTRFLAFGDSLTAGEITQPGVSSQSDDETRLHRLVLVPSASYPTQLLSRLRTRYTSQASQIDVVNAGWPSEWAEDGAIRLPSMMSNARAEAVLLLEGINELLALGAPGVPRAARALELMAKEIRGRGARAFLATLPPTRPLGPRAVPLELVQSLNAQIRSTASGEGAVLVDLYGALVSDVTRYIGSDGVHPTEAGYARIADTWLAAIRADLERAQ